MEELKACPFCKGEGKWWGGYLTGVRTYCQKCRAKINGETKAEVIAIWNNRPIEEALEKALDNLTDILDYSINGAPDMGGIDKTNYSISVVQLRKIVHLLTDIEAIRKEK